MVLDFLHTIGRIPVIAGRQRLDRLVMPINWRHMDRMQFLQSFLDPINGSTMELDVQNQPEDCEVEDCPPTTAAMDSKTRERYMKATVRDALQGYTYKALLKVFRSFQLKFNRQKHDTPCAVIDTVKEEMEQCTPKERREFLRWYLKLLKRRAQAAVANENLNYRIY